MYTTFILVTQEAEKLGAKHRPIFFRHPVLGKAQVKLELELGFSSLVCYIKFSNK